MNSRYWYTMAYGQNVSSCAPLRLVIYLAFVAQVWILQEPGSISLIFSAKFMRFWFKMKVYIFLIIMRNFTPKFTTISFPFWMGLYLSQQVKVKFKLINMYVKHVFLKSSSSVPPPNYDQSLHAKKVGLITSQ